MSEKPSSRSAAQRTPVRTIDNILLVARHASCHGTARRLAGLQRAIELYRDGHAQDLSGIAALAKILDEQDLAAFQARCEAYARTLSYP